MMDKGNKSITKRDVDFAGERKTQKEYADEFGVSERTIRRWLEQLEK